MVSVFKYIFKINFIALLGKGLRDIVIMHVSAAAEWLGLY